MLPAQPLGVTATLPCDGRDHGHHSKDLCLVQRLRHLKPRLAEVASGAFRVDRVAAVLDTISHGSRPRVLVQMVTHPNMLEVEEKGLDLYDSGANES